MVAGSEYRRRYLGIDWNDAGRIAPWEGEWNEERNPPMLEDEPKLSEGQVRKECYEARLALEEAMEGEENAVDNRGN